uniref:HeH/LEM domain-containing protein n=1 Tax=viral metagenome TaxID=1070528 RepID=A0A6C0JS56_9ZZZZ
MNLTHAAIAVLSSMIFVLSGMIGYVYWQQTRMLQHIQSLALALATHVEQVLQMNQLAPEPEEQEEEQEEDDRVSVKEPVEIVEGPPTATTPDENDTDDLQDKTSTQLRELLSKKGIPFGKRDSKTVLLQLLKATA